MYRYETHCHTSEVSACGKSTAAELVAAYYHAGYAGMVVTDHFFNGNCAIRKDLPWEERIDAFASGYRNAKEAAKDLDFDVFFGFEYNDKSTEFLIYNFSIEELKKHPELLSLSLEDFFHLVHSVGGFIIHAHPFREADYIQEIRLFPNHVDAVEVCNKSHKNPIYDQKALAYAQEYKLLPFCGSDTHDATNLLGGGMEFPRPIKDVKDFIRSMD